MASEWEMAMGVDLGMGMSTYHNGPGGVAAAPMMGHHGAGGGGYSAAHHHHHHYYGMPPAAMGDAMRVDDLLDLSNTPGAHDFFPASAAAAAGDTGHHHHHHHHHISGMGEPSGATPSATSSDHQTSMLSFADDFYIPTEEAAELEWLSKFVDDSYSDMPNYQSSAHAAMAAAAAASAANNGGGSSAGQDSCLTAAPGRGARSKRSRATAAAAAAWHSLVPRPPSQSSPSSSCSSSDFPSSNKPSAARPNGSSGSRGKKSPGPAGAEVGMEAGVRRCTHCASEKTPQWRTGPLGPKTLCNACGVRFKSGRLMPEYRPAASPTFVLTQHSNSHRKVMELRRQKELLIIRGSHRDAAAAAAAAAAASAAAGSAAATGRPELMFRDYGVC